MYWLGLVFLLFYYAIWGGGLDGPCMCLLDGGADQPTGKGNFGGRYGVAHYTNGELAALLCENV